MTERATLSWHGKRHILADVRGLTAVFDKPEAKGSTNKGPMPSEGYLASLAACTMMSVLRVAEVRKVEVEALTCQAELDYDDRDRVSMLKLRFEARSPGSKEDWEVIARMAGKFCTIEQLTKPPIAKTFVLNGKDHITVEKAE
jgi:putative redox protein